MFQLAAALGAIFAGLFMLITQGLPLWRARREGVLVSRGYGSARIERSADPDRFENLLRQRLRGLFPGLILILVGMVFLVQFIWFVANVAAR